MNELGKYPRLVVAGEKISPEQADVVLIRTNFMSVNSDDPEWASAAEAVLGLPDSSQALKEMAEVNARGLTYDWNYFHAQVEAARRRLGWIPLDYLLNDQMDSCWWGGPHGWCDWDGNIGCSSHDIGSWPTVDGITEEWREVAEAFPFLTLDAQVVPDVSTGAIAAQWHVEGGLVRQTGITRLVRPLEEAAFRGPGSPEWVSGVTIERLERAVANTLAALGRGPLNA